MGSNSLPEVAVIGAGVFGCWSALSLLDSGCKTRLIEAWSPAHSRASSAGESRLIRMGYGSKRHYTAWALESLEKWEAAQQEWDCELLIRSGVLWAAQSSDPDLEASLAALSEMRIPHEVLSPRDLSRRYPQFSLDGLGQAVLEPHSGVLLARKACRRAVEVFRSRGGELVQGRVLPLQAEKTEIRSLMLEDGREIRADRFLFCCGPWLPQLFPDLLAMALQPTRQEVFFFGTPSGSDLFDLGRMPAWIELGGEKFYGVPACAGRGFKVASDLQGPPCDPTRQERTPTESELAKARSYLEMRFPGMTGAPLVETRVCQYAASFDSDLLIGAHPHYNNVFIAGGGSGHGFKLGPAVGRRAADLLLGKGRIRPEVNLERVME